MKTIGNNKVAEIVEELNAFVKEHRIKPGDYQGHVASTFFTNDYQELDFVIEDACEYYKCNDGELNSAYCKVFGVGPLSNF
jgi:hypothetical protein